ncbi:hypothetical protein HDE_11153 [Halotydeus destructor]|nr:hypothetical protein HDE_11153 [Halotydeus destructor]
MATSYFAIFLLTGLLWSVSGRALSTFEGIQHVEQGEVSYDVRLTNLKLVRRQFDPMTNLRITGNITLKFNSAGSTFERILSSGALEAHRLGSGPLTVTLPLEMHMLQTVEATYATTDQRILDVDRIVLVPHVNSPLDSDYDFDEPTPAMCAHVFGYISGVIRTHKFEPCTV